MARWGFQSHEDRAEAASGLPASVPIRDLRRIRLEPEDSLAVLVKDQLSQDAAVRIHREAQRLFGPDRHIIVLDSGTDLAAVSKAVARAVQ